MTFPVFLVGLAIQTGFGDGGDVSDLHTSFLGALLLLIAEPTAWLFSFDFVEAGRFTILFVGALTSFPLWYMTGSALAARRERWRSWVQSYSVGCIGWTALNLVGFFVLASLAG